MRAVWLGVPKYFLEQRHRDGLDKRDEVWDGELHMVPPPGSAHQRHATDLARLLFPIAARRRMEVWGTTGVYDHDDNFRVPDVAIACVEQRSARGLEGAELVIEILSPTSEAPQKRPFYAARGVKEMWLIDPSTCAFEILSLLEDRYVTVHGGVSPLLNVELATLAGTAPRLRITDGDYVVDV